MNGLRILIIIALISAGLAVWSQPDSVEAVSTLFIKVTLYPDRLGLIDIEDFPSADTHAEVKIYDYEGGSVLWQDNSVDINKYDAAEIEDVDIGEGNHITVVGKPSDTSASFTIQKVVITAVDDDNEKISGVSEPNTEVSVVAKVKHGDLVEKVKVTSDGSGDWIAQFTEDINAGLQLNAFIFNGDDHQTKYSIFPPKFTIWRPAGWIRCDGFTPDHEVHMEVYDAPLPGGTLTISQTITTDDSGDCSERDFSINSGDYILITETRSGGKGIDRYKDTDVSDITLDYVGENLTYYGTCTNCSEVLVDIGESGHSDEAVGPVNSGDWSYQITITDTTVVPGKEYWNNAQVYDDDGDSTGTWNPGYYTRIKGNNISLRNYEIGSAVNISIEDNLGSVVLPSTTYTIPTSGKLNVRYSDHGTEVLTNYKILVKSTSGDMMDSVIKQEISVRKVDPYEDKMFGTGPAGSYVVAIVDDEVDFYVEEALVDQDGNWEADFSPVEVEDMLYHWMLIRDWDSDHTQYYLDEHDGDGDYIADSIDNAPDDPNWDQSDIDGDDVGDVADPCPSDPDDECDETGSAAESIGSEGGDVETPNGSTEVSIPPDALAKDTSISITEAEPTFEIVTGEGEAKAVSCVEIGPSGTLFSVPVSIVLSWEDKNGDGVVDDTIFLEKNLFVSKDGVKISPMCSELNSGCYPEKNTFTVEVTSLSEFALAAMDVPAFIDFLPLVMR